MKAVLVGIQLPRVSDSELKASLAELARLVETLGHEVVGQLTQRRPSTEGAIVLGEGKLRELAQWTGGPGEVQPMVDVKKHKAALRAEKLKAEAEAAANEESEEEFADQELQEYDSDNSDESVLTDHSEDPKPEVIIFDCELSPSQLRNLESATGVKVLDRTGVIIEIFSRHARTRAARIQVEIARLSYVSPRLRETAGTGDREGGGIGGKGAGETAYELDRRRIRDRIKELKDELVSVQSELEVRRSRRSSENCVALVGYTNAGKSSLMRALTGSDIYIADKLFATLDTTVRPIQPETTPNILLTDTVGFIKQLPHDLVASFRSTLDEALNADLLLFVVDAADETFRAQLEVTRQVLNEIGATESASWVVLNKRDRLSHVDQMMLKREFPDAVMISTFDAEDITALRQKLIDHFESLMQEETILVPYATQRAIGELRENAKILSEEYDGEGTRFRVRAHAIFLARFKKKFEL